VYQLRQTDTFAKWLRGLRDARSKARTLSKTGQGGARLESARLGNLGDSKVVGGGIREMRVHTGPGYRVYFVRRQKVVLILLCGGDKSSQGPDIRRAMQLAEEIEE
jgi:putative addiction module killer protein